MATRRSHPPSWRRPEGRSGNQPVPDGLPRDDPQGLAPWLDRHLDHLAVRNYSPLTIKGRRRALTAFLQWGQERDLMRPQEVTRPILESYQRALYRHRKQNGQPLGFNTQRGYMVSLKEFFRWLCRQDVLLHNPASELEMPRNEHRLPKGALNESEIETILAGPDISGPIGLRDRALLEVLYSTGIRRMELIRLEIGDLNLERGVLMVRQGKGKKDRVVPVGTRALSWLHKYLTDARQEILIDPSVQALFVSGYGDGPMSAGYLTRLVTDYIRRAGVTKGGCHVFRHSCATLMLENGADIRFIQQILGHAHLTSTQIYTEVSIAQLQRVHAMTHPAEKPAAVVPLPMPAAFNHPHAPRQTA